MIASLLLFHPVSACLGQTAQAVEQLASTERVGVQTPSGCRKKKNNFLRPQLGAIVIFYFLQRTTARRDECFEIKG